MTCDWCDWTEVFFLLIVENESDVVFVCCRMRIMEWCQWLLGLGFDSFPPPWFLVCSMGCIIFSSIVGYQSLLLWFLFPHIVSSN